MLSVIIPTYNEAKNIENTLLDINHFFSENSVLNPEVIVVDDGSRDQTAAIVEGLKQRLPYLNLIKNPRNRGRGAVIKQGMLAGRGQYLLFMDADNATRIRELIKFMPHIQDRYDIVLGSRRLKKTGITIEQPLQRRLMGGIFIRLTHWILNIPKFDYNCGFKLFKKEAVQKLFPKIKREDWSYDAEIFLIAKKLELKIKEVPVNWKHGAGSKISPLRDGLKTLLALFAIRRDDLRGKYA